MGRNRILRRGIAWLSALAVLISLVAMVWNLEPVEPEQSIPARAQALAVEPVKSGRGDLTEPTEESTEPTEESTEPTEPPEETTPLETEPEVPPQTKPSTTSATNPTAPPVTDPPEPPVEIKPGTGESGESGDSKTPGEGPGGNSGQEPEDPSEGPSIDSAPRIVTSLTNCVLTYSQLTNDLLPFEAYIVNATPEMYLRVKIQNSKTPQNGAYLTANGRNFETTLARQERNTITLYLKEGEKTLLTRSYVIEYQADKADEHTPTVGDHPPIITTSLDTWQGEMVNRNYTFVVSARTYQGRAIYASSILVQMDGQTVAKPTGGGTYEYELHFPDPVVGDYAEHQITVLAWDEEGNSAYREYRITYHYINTGDVIGTAYLLIDATTVGLGIMESTYEYEVRQDEPATYAVLEMLEAYGYQAEYGGTPDVGFYLRRISRGGMTDYAQVPDNLWQKILADGLMLTGKSSPDSLGELDYTQGSGWMYSINGELYAGKSLSDYHLTPGDTVYLRYTLAYGKDIGGSDSSGLLRTYCGRWIGGTYIDQHAWGADQQTKAPTCADPGEQAQICSVCGDTRVTAMVPELGHDWTETSRQEPSEEEAGWIEYTCSRCGETWKEEMEPDEEDAAPNLMRGAGYDFAEEAVGQAVDAALSYLSQAQTAQGIFSGGAESSAQAITALCALGIERMTALPKTAAPC